MASPVDWYEKGTIHGKCWASGGRVLDYSDVLGKLGLLFLISYKFTPTPEWKGDKGETFLLMVRN